MRLLMKRGLLSLGGRRIFPGELAACSRDERFMRRPCCMFPKGISAFRAQPADGARQCGPLPTRYDRGLIISTGEPTAGSRGSDEAAMLPRELAIRVMRASLISQPRDGLA